MPIQRATYCILVIAFFLPATSRGEQSTLADFTKGFDLSSVESHDATLGVQNGRLCMEIPNTAESAGITLKPSGGRWNLAQYHEIGIDVKNVGSEAATIRCEAVSPATDGKRHVAAASIVLPAGERNVVRIRLSQALPPELRLSLVGMRVRPLGIFSDVDSSNVTELSLVVVKPAKGTRITFGRPRAWILTEPNEPIDADDLFPMIDAFGQYVHKEWTGKTHSVEDLAANKKAETADLAAHPGPVEWDQYGGWKNGPQLKATGFFRTEKHNGKWWLVDPEGRLFWSMGINCVNSREGRTAVTDREHWFAELPKQDSEFAPFYRQNNGAAHGYYKNKEFLEFQFYRSNLFRKYGKDWDAAFAQTANQRLRSWGINTIACMSEDTSILLHKTPYVDMFGGKAKRIEGSSGYWRKFPDAFDPDFPVESKRQMAKRKSVGDPWCIGIFVENELGWGNELSLAVATLRSPPEQPAKKVFIADLRKKYSTIDKLNAAWAAKHASWDALAECTAPPDKKRARKDLEAFSQHLSEEYFAVTRAAIKELAPDMLDLGCRFSRSNPIAVRAAGKYCDIISFNRYQYTVADLRLPKGVDKPVLIGEFQFGAVDRGMFNASLSPTADQADRARTYKDYVESAVDNPLIIGAHWFQYTDQPCTGRGDEENFQIGFVDICDTPYPEIIHVAREIGNQLYQRRNSP